jgi:signal transduction histidine kinase
MFRKLRLKLTLINIVIMSFLLIIFISGTYFIMQIQIFSQSEQLIQIYANEVGSNSIQPIGHDHHLAKYFYVKTDVSGKIIASSSVTPLTKDQLSRLVDKVFDKNEPRGEVDFHDGIYTYLKVPLKQTTGFIVAFVDVERDREILRDLLLTLSIGGVICLGFAYYGSRFMADRAMAPIKRSWQRQQDFVADASHELRTPLAVLQVNLELVKGNPDETVASQAKWLDNSLLEMKRMSKLVDDLLFLARADSHQQTLEIKSFPLNMALQEVSESFRPLAANKGVHLESSFASNTIYSGDENRLKQLIVILLDNALKHTPPGGQITLDLQNWGTLVEIIVSDNGDGIEPEHLAKIFERFYRVDKSRSQNKGGIGLGLSIADWIIKSHHGRVKVSSSPGKGTTFVVSLPKGNKETEIKK